MDFLHLLLYASIGGIIPCLFWLVFWLRETREHPEPPRTVLACFVAGMLTTVLVIPLQYLVTHVFESYSTEALTVWAFLEEIIKFAACWFVVLRRHKDHAPIDIVIYMITIALGFAALENTLYLLTPLYDGNIIDTLMTGNIRFIGSTLLHTVASSVIGVFLAFAYYKQPHLKEEYGFIGIFIAGVLHTLFNFLILSESGAQAFLAFVSVWLLVIVLIVTLEKVKTITNPININTSSN